MTDISAQVRIKIVCISVIALAACTPLNQQVPVVSSPTLQGTTPTPTVESPAFLPTPSETVLLPSPGEVFCDDEQVQAAISSLGIAIVTGDGQALANIIDPKSGLEIYYTAASQPVNIPFAEVSGLFGSSSAYAWGIHPGSGMPVEGSFGEIILPEMMDVFNRTYSQGCQTLARGTGTGPTTATIQWPQAFKDTPYVALYRAAGPRDNELDWRTWAVGFTVVDGLPKVRVLVQYFWEI